MIRLWWVFITCLFASSPANAGFSSAIGPFAIQDTFEAANLTPYMEYLPDPNGELTPAGALLHGGWHPLPYGGISYSATPVWTRITLWNRTSVPVRLVLQNPRSGVNRIDVYQMDQLHVVSHEAIGLSPPRNAQPDWGRFPTVPVTVPASGSLMILARISTIGPIDPGWIARTRRAHSTWQAGDSWLRGVFAGVVLAMMIYSLWFWRSLRQPILLAYAGFGLLLFLSSLTYQGFYRLYSFGLPLMVGFFSTWVTGGLLVASMVLIAMYLFETKTSLPRLHTLLRWVFAAQLSGVAVILAGITTGNTAHASLLLYGATILNSVTLLITGVAAWRRGLAGAGYYLAGQGGVMLSIMLIAAAQFGLRFDADIRSLFLPAATLVEVILLAKAISERLAHMRQELKARRSYAITQSRYAALGKTIGLITHQWRAPLARQGALLTELAVDLQQFAAEGREERIQHEWLPRMQQNLTLLDQTVRDFRAYFSAEQPATPFDLTPVISQTCSLLTWQQSLPNLQIEWDPPAMVVPVIGEQKALAHALLIIIDNAVETLLTREVDQPTIRLCCLLLPGQVTIHIEDNAGGIVIQPIERIFDEFVSAGKANGSGMGLFFARMLVEDRLKGTLSAHNTESGACLTITLNLQAVV